MTLFPLATGVAPVTAPQPSSPEAPKAGAPDTRESFLRTWAGSDSHSAEASAGPPAAVSWYAARPYSLTAGVAEFASDLRTAETVEDLEATLERFLEGPERSVTDEFMDLMSNKFILINPLYEELDRLGQGLQTLRAAAQGQQGDAQATFYAAADTRIQDKLEAVRTLIKVQMEQRITARLDLPEALSAIPIPDSPNVGHPLDHLLDTRDARL